MSRNTLTTIIPEEYDLALEEKLVAVSVLYYLRSLPMYSARQLLKDAVQPRVLALPQQNEPPTIRNCDLDGRKLAALIDAAIRYAAAELETWSEVAEAFEHLCSTSGEQVVRSITPDLCGFFIDCYRALRWQATPR